MNSIKWKDFQKKIEKDQTNHKADLYARWFVWKLSAPISFLMVRTPFSANQITVFQEIVGVIGAVLLACIEIKYAIFGIILLQIGYIFDCVDGEVARFKNQQSVRGVYLDLIGHQIVIPMYIFFNGLGVYLRLGYIDAIILGFLGALFLLRTDVFSMFSVVNTMIEKGDNRNYDPSLLNQKINKNKSEIVFKKRTGWKWVIRKKWSYPDSMNMLTIAVLLDYFFEPFYFNEKTISYAYIFTYWFTIPIVIGRLFSYTKIFNQDEISQHFHRIVNKSKTKF
ncbi:MAG: CDP-alcohol phosphatidyltransferase family protein [Candidatus Marinimicrobia bacterium]|jgi:phosphatidylglycerophosphate synthase|nr:CDP-alcohol phosphatidyltransferase family protein [Candidatus Neomarinimicrobiota bacterium]|tara:strand:- start:739 stop:1578 length:840 start_codon:yes stop_codon:yes gene_type:complete